MKKNILYLAMILIGFGCCSKQNKGGQENNTNYSFGTINWHGEWIEKDTTNRTYPCTIDSTILTFFHTWADSTTWEFKNIPDSTLAGINHGTGMWLRNNYGLWSRTCLVEYFWDLGIFHPDDMSAILLTSYHKFLNDEELRVVKQVEMYKTFWKHEMDIEYKLEDSLDWEFPPSMWDFGITVYKYDSNRVRARQLIDTISIN